MIGRFLCWFVSKRDLIVEVDRLKAELELEKVKTYEAKRRAELSEETLTVQREWLQSMAAVARFEFANHQAHADALNARGK